MIKEGDRYKTLSGLEACITHIETEGLYPVRGFIRKDDNTTQRVCWTEKGTYKVQYSDADVTPLDLEDSDDTLNQNIRASRNLDAYNKAVEKYKHIKIWDVVLVWSGDTTEKTEAYYMAINLDGKIVTAPNIDCWKSSDILIWDHMELK